MAKNLIMIMLNDIEILIIEHNYSPIWKRVYWAIKKQWR